MARCPAHEDGTPSLSITQAERRVLVHCHAGCSQADVLAALRARRLWSDEAGPQRFTPRRRPRPPRPQPSAFAQEIWRDAHPARGTLVETYLAARGLTLPDRPVLRFHPGLLHRDDGGRWPAMVALVQHGIDGTAQAIHRTFIARDGRGKAAVPSPRMTLGPCSGGAVRLAEAGATLMVGEGIETCLAAMQASGLPAWSALSASFMASLHLPAYVRDVMVLADGDDAGERAACAAAERWRDEGRRVRIARPPRGMDFNDMLVKDAP